MLKDRAISAFLSKKGSTVLRTFLCDKIDRAIKNKLV